MKLDAEDSRLAELRAAGLISYRELLKHPRWIEKKTRVLYRDRKTCTNCEFKSNRWIHIGYDLDVHHLYYHETGLPWLVPYEALVTRCKGCHALHSFFGNAIDDIPNPKTCYPFESVKEAARVLTLIKARDFVKEISWEGDEARVLWKDLSAWERFGCAFKYFCGSNVHINHYTPKVS